MSDIQLVKNDMGKLQGISPADEQAWQEFRALVVDMGAGEMVKMSYSRPRIGWMHRKFFAMLNVGFDHWDTPRVRKHYKGMPVEKNFDQFREDITILAGFYEQTFDLRGRLLLKAKSISFGKMEQDEFEALYSAVANVILEKVLANYTRDDLDRVVAEILNFTHGER